MEYYLHLCILITLYWLLGQSFNLVFGLGGLFNLAHVAIYAIGAYSCALLSTELGLGFWPCLLVGGLLPALISLFLGEISLRLTQDYFAIGSLALSSVVTALLINWKELTRGVLGIAGIPRPTVFGYEFLEIGNFLVLSFCVSAVGCLCLYLCFRSPYARSLRAQSEFDMAAQALGRNTRRARMYCFMIGSFWAGIAGVLFAYYLNYIDPSSFSLTEMVLILTIPVVGRPGSFWGTMLATVVMVVMIPEGLRFAIDDASLSSLLGPLRQLAYGLVLFGIVYLFRTKMFPKQREI